MTKFILSKPLSNGRFIVSSDELMVVNPSELKGDTMTVAVREVDPELLKKKFEESHRPLMEEWVKMTPGETTSSEIARMIRLFSKFAKDRIERYEHKFITANVFIDNPRLQGLFVDFFGEEAVGRLYEDGYYDPFDSVGVRSVETLTEEIKKSIRFPSDMKNPYVVLSAAMSILSVMNNTD